LYYRSTAAVVWWLVLQCRCRIVRARAPRNRAALAHLALSKLMGQKLFISKERFLFQ
jgi:hypothetical protein